MTLTLKQTELYKQLKHLDNPASLYVEDERLLRDVWNVEQDLPSLAMESRTKSRKTIRFEGSLPWLKDLTKLAALVAVGSRRWGIARLQEVLYATRSLDAWLFKHQYLTPSVLTVAVVQQWAQVTTAKHRNSLNGLLRVLRLLDCIQIQVKLPRRNKSKPPKTIPEEVKYKLDLAFEQLDAPIYLVFKILEAAGGRSCEIPHVPLDCLRIREGVFRIRLCTGKLGNIQKELDLPEELVTLLQKQQIFTRQRFGEDFQWLFPNWTGRQLGFSSNIWPPRVEYQEKQLEGVNAKLNKLLKRIIKNNDIRTKDGKLVHVTTHMFRRTYGTMADRMGKRPDQIQHALRHVNPDMQDYYVHVLPQEQAKRIERVLVDRSGKRTLYQTDRDSEFLRKEWRARQVELVPLS